MQLHKKNILGFSLIELMIVMAVISVLSLIAVPSYLRYLQRASIAESITTIGEYKTAIGTYYSITGTLPASGETLAGGPADLPYGVAVTDNLPESLEQITLNGNGNGIHIEIIFTSDTFPTFASNNRRIYLAAKPSGQRVIFKCGNFTTNASSSTDLGFTNRAILPNKCNYNGIDDWLDT